MLHDLVRFPLLFAYHNRLPQTLFKPHVRLETKFRFRDWYPICGAAVHSA